MKRRVGDRGRRCASSTASRRVSTRERAHGGAELVEPALRLPRRHGPGARRRPRSAGRAPRARRWCSSSSRSKSQPARHSAPPTRARVPGMRANLAARHLDPGCYRSVASPPMSITKLGHRRVGDHGVGHRRGGGQGGHRGRPAVAPAGDGRRHGRRLWRSRSPSRSSGASSRRPPPRRSSPASSATDDLHALPTATS